MSSHLSQPLNAVSRPKPDDGDGDDTESVVSERSGEASTLDSDFWEALQVFETPGYLTSYFTLPELSRSGLSVYHVGDIALPLGEIQARQIMGQAKRYKSLGPNDPWKLDPTQFKLDYSVWESRLKALYRHIAPGLGYFGQGWTDMTCPRPSAVLLLEKGCAVDCHYLHTGAGHIMIYLPSADHQGGEIVVKLRGQEKTVFDPKNTEEHFASWYPDSKPQPVKSGYALVIVFSFVSVRSDVSESALLVRDETRAIRHTLKRWLAEDVESRGRNALYYPLERDYKGRKLRFRELTHGDEGRLQVLKKLSEKLAFKLYIGHVEQEQKKLENSDSYEEIKGGACITKLVDLDGRLVTKNLNLDKAHVREGFFDGIKWESEQHGAPSSIRKGRMTFFVVVPSDAILRFFLQRSSDNSSPAVEQIPQLLGHYARICVSSQHSKSSLSMFKELCELMWDSSDRETQIQSLKKPVFQNNDLSDVLRATVQLKWYPWFEKIAATHEGSLPTSFFNWVPEYFHNSTRNIDKWFRPLEKGLSAAVLSYPRPKQQVRAVETLFPILIADSGRLVPFPPESLIRWARQVLQESIKTCGSKKLDRRDGEALVKLSLYFDDPFAIISQVYVGHPFLLFYPFSSQIDPGNKPDAFVGFMSEIDLFGRYDYISLYTDACRLGEFVFGEPMDANESDDGGSHDDFAWPSDDDDYMFDPHMDLDEPDFDPFGYHAHNRQAYQEYQQYASLGGKAATEVEETHIHYTALSFWIQKLMDISTKNDDIFTLALSKMGEVAPQISIADFHSLWIPVLKGMAPKMTRLILEKSKDPNTLLWRKNNYTLIKAYLDTYVGQWPRRPSLVQDGVDCGCADCKGLSVFLADASLKVGHFSANKWRCKHLIEELCAANADVYTERINFEGSPKKQKLTVTKSRTKMLSRYRQAWRERRDEASKHLGSFEQKHLAALLGPKWMTLFSMAHLGGPSLSDKDMRKALRMKTARTSTPKAPPFLEPSTIAMFFGGLPAMSMEEEFL
ncbi:hypothetical protein TASIC1_0006057400 [Trichoderma asperellum]|uniref:Uncharacterized protein n=1 Tax=Trichoderma asperellum TaxID=101201 RepID=A0A6V8QUS9_TRIAP|nr:hypothetical protein TASIC1_0006057400 [Trichoderma asperellum]